MASKTLARTGLSLVNRLFNPSNLKTSPNLLLTCSRFEISLRLQQQQQQHQQQTNSNNKLAISTLLSPCKSTQSSLLASFGEGKSTFLPRGNVHSFPRTPSDPEHNQEMRLHQVNLCSYFQNERINLAPLSGRELMVSLPARQPRAVGE
ncbi:hypothetical protein Scep_010494 [Stephania cephalantha]|uniref:Uncharacterized protein n=1 Tax=Stephania cephalantha TaxID=152367 RepID=A0AAP0PDD2_9MAGN